MEDIEIFKVKVTNRLSGEISEHEIKNMWEAKELYLELSASETAIKNAKRQLANFLNDQLGQDNEYKFVDGKVLRRVQRESRVWTLDGLKSIGLDEDAIMVVSKVSMTDARALIDEMILRGDVAPDAKKQLDASADVNTSAPFVEIR